MSTEQYPLVVFSGSERKGLIDKGDGKTSKKGKEGKTLDPPMYDPDGQADDRPAGRLPELDEDDSELDRCLINPYDLRCLVGVRQVDQDDGYEGRTKRLLDGPKTQVPGVQQTVNSETPVPVVIEVGRSGWEDSNSDNANGTPSVPHGRLGLPDGRSSKLSWAGLNWIGLSGSGEAVLVSLLFGLVSIWLLWKRVKGKIEEKIREAAIREGVKEVGLENGSAKAAAGQREVVDKVDELLERSVPKGIVRKDAPPSLDLQDNTSALNGEALGTPTAIPAPDTPSLNTAGLDEGDDSEGEGEGGPAATPGKRRVRRGKRGKKKKPGVAATSGDGDEKEEEKKPSSLILTSSSPKPPVVQQPSLTVSDTILGQLPSLANRTPLIILHPRIRLSWNSRLPRLTTRPGSRCQKASTRLCYTRRAGSVHPSRIRRPPQRHPLLLPRIPRELSLHRTRALSGLVGGYHRIARPRCLEGHCDQL